MYVTRLELRARVFADLRWDRPLAPTKQKKRETNKKQITSDQCFHDVGVAPLRGRKSRGRPNIRAGGVRVRTRFEQRNDAIEVA
jgi:hypothetical protein